MIKKIKYICLGLIGYLKTKKMNINKLKKTIKHVQSVMDINYGNEFEFTQKIKIMLPKTKFKLLGEQLIVGKDNKIGKCDLWLANTNNFLLSLELKVGEPNNSKKYNFLKTQVTKYTEFMKFYYPTHNVYGLGAYKCISGIPDILKPSIKYISYIDPIDLVHINELANLKSRIENECLN